MALPSPAPDPIAERPARIAGRYVVEAELAVGGMGAVYRVRDTSTNRTLALKRLLASAGRVGAALFRREYHTLVLLKHPRIIEVLDYGIDGGAPYYTMELLDGGDLRALAPLPYAEACRHLRDVASSLALLAAHRLVHRDLTARNVRVTSDGRCKLIDFGALSPFGVTDTVVGTPPYVPPEALRGLPLDQRADLFSLGALAYFLLTRSHAFPARSLNELEASWRKRPQRPSAKVLRLIEQGASLEPIPSAVDDLVLSLLSLDPLARPQNAAEVIERLGTVLGLEREPGPSARESYVLSAALVGRTREMERARTLASRLTEGIGGVLSIRHAAGAGGTRLLNEIGLEVRLAGGTVLRVDAEVQRGPLAVVHALAERLVTALPVEARAMAPGELAALGWVRPQSSSERPLARHAQADPTGAPLAVRLGIHAALEKWFLTVASSRPLAILVDNALQTDEGSAAFLAYLAGVGKDHALLVVAALRAGDPTPAPAAMARLESSGECLELGPLSAADTSALVESVFGNVPNTERLAHWIHRLSGGNPLQLMDLSQYLVRHDVARYVDGIWVLPPELPVDLPSRMEDAQEHGLSLLHPSTLMLASALAVHEGPLSVELCLALADTEPGEAFAALDELVSAGILRGYEGAYQFARKATRERLLARLAADDQRRLHRKLGEHFVGAPSPDLTATLDAGWHLFLGGEEERGAEILRRVGLELAQADELPEAVPVLEAAVTVYRKLDRPRNEICGLLHPLAFAGYYVDRRLADRYADEALDLLAQEIGLAVTSRLRPYLGTYLSLIAGLVYALFLHCFNGRGGVRGLSENISITGGISTALTGASVICLDTEGAARRAAVFEPFQGLGLWHAGAFCHAMATRLVGLTQDRAAETIEALDVLRRRLDAPRGVIGFPDRMKPIARGGLLYALGVLEGFMDEPLALERANELESCGLRLYDMVACQIRANYHACRGEITLAREYERQVEMHAIRNGSTWQAEVWAPISHLIACNLTYDLIGLKRTAEELERLSHEIPSLGRYARAARAGLMVLHGEHAAAIPAMEQIVLETPPRDFLGWTRHASELAAAYNETGQHDRAEALCDAIARTLTENDRRLVVLYLGIEIQLALAEAGLGRAADAARRLDDLVAKHASNNGPVTLGSLHRARAQVARGTGDLDAARHHHGRMEFWFRSTGNPSLIAECERQASLMRGPSSPPAPSSDPDAATVMERARTDGHGDDLTEAATTLGTKTLTPPSVSS